MTEEPIKDRIQKLREKINEGNSWEQSRFKRVLKKIGLIATPIIIAGTLTTGILARDFLLKRQNYPERNVLFRSSNVTYLAGSEGEKKEGEADRESVTKVYEGGLMSKVGTFLFETTRESRGDIDYFNMDNSQHIRVASSTKKPEVVQPGLRIGGSLNFREEFAEIVVGPHSKLPQKYTVYKFIPERGHEEKEILVIEQEKGTRIMINRLIDVRSFGLGWLFGKNFRGGTFLESYGERDPEKIEEVLRKIEQLDTVETRNKAEREKVIRAILELENSIPKKTIYRSYEGGIVDIFPQESTIYLTHVPSFLERTKHFWGFDRHDKHRLRVENYWDLWPGNYWPLNKIKFGSGKNIAVPFGKCNNGGYTLEDKFGVVAQIDIKDFLLFYGQDVLYSYFLDLNGDGHINHEKELIGQVLQRTTFDKKTALESIHEEKTESDVTKTVNYSFMAPDADIERGARFFNLCGYVESFIPDQIHRGFGKHSLLGLINEQRSDIMFYRDLTIKNMSRALSQESVLVADHDIVNVLVATRRPYAKEVAEAYGIAQDFEGGFDYLTNPQLMERTEVGPIPATLLTIVGLTTGTMYLRRKRQRNSQTEKSILNNTKT